MSETELRLRNLEVSERERLSMPAVCDAMPVHMTVGNTHKCNLDCPMCFKEYEPGKNMSYRTMPLEEFRSIADQAFPTASRVTLTVSGDPLVSENIIDELAIGGAHGVEFEITTNGVMLRHGPMTDLLLAHCGTLTISFDSATKETYEEIRRGSDFEKVLEALRMFSAAKAKAGHGPLFAAMAVLMRRNLKELPDWVRLMHSVGIEHLSVDHIIVPDWNDSASCIHEKELTNRMMAEAQAVADELGIPIHMPLPYELDVTDLPEEKIEEGELSVQLPATGFVESAPESSQSMDSEPESTKGAEKVFVRCPYLWSDSWVGYDGSVSPCCNAQYLEKMGSVLEQSFEEIWNGKKYRALRSSLVNGTPPPVCRNCHLAIRETETGETFVKAT